jgi:gliding motility-associated-like protein
VNKISGEDYSWSISGGSISSGQNTDKITADWGTAGNAWVGVKSTGYDPINKRVCQSSLYKLNVILHPTPTANIFPDLQPEQCQQNNQFFTLVDFSALNGVDFGDSIDYQITPNTGLTLETISGVGKPKPGKLKISLNQFGTFTIKARIISKHGCPGPWDQTQITINPKPINTQLVGDSVICNPNVSNLGYVINGNAGSTFTWKLIGGNWANNPGTNNSGSVNWDSLAPLRNITVREISDKGCPGDSISWNIYYDNPWIESRLVTVSPPPDKDGKILVEYQLKNSPRPNGPVYIQRRPFNSGQFWNVGQGPINGTEFQDLDVKPDAFSYDYRAMILNQCGDTLYSPINTSILLTGQRTGPMSMSFTFTPYLGWAVEKYELYRELINKTGYELYQTYPGNTSDSFNNGEEHFGQKYRIKAYELGGSRVSWSNDILLYFDPVMFVPNAFTPDGKGTNDIFKPVISGVLDYQFRIYNRWGEKLAEFRNESEGWDGTYNGQNAPDGVYVYQISFKDYKEEIYQFSGTVQLLR